MEVLHHITHSSHCRGGPVCREILTWQGLGPHFSRWIGESKKVGLRGGSWSIFRRDKILELIWAMREGQQGRGAV